MRLPKLDKRLALIYEMLDGADSVCDIGADHGKLALILSKNGAKVIATDISEQSLRKTQRLINLHKADVDLRVGDGLKVIAPGEAKTCVMAGMGQNTIINIINDSIETVRAMDFLVMQPMNGEYDLRNYLSEAGFGITDERTATEGRRMYCVIKAVPFAQEKLTEAQKQFGPRILENMDSSENKKYISHNKSVLKDIILAMETAGDTNIKKYSAIIDAIDEIEVKSENS